LKRELWHDTFKGPAETRKFLTAENAEIKAVLTEIGLAK
jgi:hypothetical protein